MGVLLPPRVVSFITPARAPLQETIPLHRLSPVPTTGEVPDSGTPTGLRLGTAFCTAWESAPETAPPGCAASAKAVFQPAKVLLNALL